MKKSFLLGLSVLAFFSAPLFAAEKKQKTEKAPDFQIDVDANTYDPNAFKGIKNAKVGTLPSYKSELPTREEREAIFSKVKGLENHLDAYDELDRDLLFMKASYKEVPALSKEFPKIPKNLLSQLKSAIKKGAQK